jgi:hypothetical protein
VPDRLREHLLARLDAERGDWYKRWAGHGLRVAVAAAACVLLLVGAVYGWSQYRYWTRPALDPEQAYQEARKREMSPPERGEVEKEMGMRTVLPDLNFRYLTTHGKATFQGVEVPLLVFNRDDDTGHNHAVVYIVSDRQLNLKELMGNYESPGGYQNKVSILHQPGGSYAFVIEHTGETYDWLKPPQ